VGNEHDTSGLLDKNVYKNNKSWKPKQEIGNEQVENNKTTIKKQTT
jgi:hypothetical protein